MSSETVADTPSVQTTTIGPVDTSERIDSIDCVERSGRTGDIDNQYIRVWAAFIGFVKSRANGSGESS